eukprot:jgi/Orpsp1_1/1185987/evm.model.c7180000096358.1
MKIIIILTINLLFLINSILAIDSAGGECQYINNFIGESDSFDCCTKFSITCENNHITKIVINHSELHWFIPYNIGKLTELEELDLSYNKLYGSIPPEIGNLTKLKWLRLNGNQLTGEIPEEIGQLSNLFLLYLDDNQLTGSIPKGMGKLTKLRM